MTQRQLLNFTADLGMALMQCGAEISRVEETIHRIFRAYEEPTGEAFAIPNCLIVSVGEGEEPATRMRRISGTSVNIARLEAFNDLSRRLCSQTPSYAIAVEWMEQARSVTGRNGFCMELLGHVLSTAFFALFFGGNALDALFAAVAGALMCVILPRMRRLGGSFFIRTIAGGAIAGLVALIAIVLVPSCNMGCITIGTIMLLVPGLLMTNGVRDVMLGDTMSGISKLCEAMLTAVAIALGVGLLLGLSANLGFVDTTRSHAEVILPFWLKSLYAFIACAGFGLLYQIRSTGLLICALGGALGTCVYACMSPLFPSVACAFFGSMVISLYSEVMARVRKCPVTSYQLVGLFPLVPGGGIYYTMSAAIDGNLDLAGSLGMETLGIAGALSIGLLVVSAISGMIFSKMRGKK